MATKNVESEEEPKVTAKVPKTAAKKTAAKKSKVEEVENLEETDIQEEESEVPEDYVTEAAIEDAPEKSEEDEEDGIFDEEIDDDALAEMEAMFKKMFEKRRIHAASKNERKKIYKSNNVIAEKGAKVETEKSRMKVEAQALIQAARSVPKKIIKVIIDGTESTENGFIMATATAKDTDGNFVIKIPVEQLFMYNPRDYMGDAGAEYLKREIQSRINSEAYVCIYDVIEKEKVAYGSRLAAMEALGISNYVKKQSDGIAKVFNEAIVQGTIVSVRKDRVRVEVLGAETTIKSDQLSWKALGPLYDEFSVGEKINVKVSDIKVVDHVANDKKYKIITLTASAKEAMPNPAELFYDQFHVGDRCGAVIKSITEVGVFVNVKNKMDALCTIPASGTPISGMQCVVEITGCDDEKKRLFGRIIRLN